MHWTIKRGLLELIKIIKTKKNFKLHEFRFSFKKSKIFLKKRSIIE